MSRGDFYIQQGVLVVLVEFTNDADGVIVWNVDATNENGDAYELQPDEAAQLVATLEEKINRALNMAPFAGLSSIPEILY